MKHLLSFALAAAASMAVAGGALAQQEPGRPEAARAATAQSSIGGPFALVDQNGRPVTDADFRGKWMLIYFGYTHCPDACPTALNAMAEILDGLGPERAKVQPIFITVDPERDTPAVMKDYTAAFEANIIGLTGTPEQVAAAAKAYRVHYKKNPRPDGDYAMDHSSIMFLMNPEGRFVRLFPNEMASDKMTQKIREALG
jgi:cytochrome oxidase Cu insertion factor (SCO1/SenC/PrrC family)